jgi:anaerobic selenocysteine-containing dehydrogenase
VPPLEPALRFLAPRPQAELSPEDARRIGVGPGDPVVVEGNGHSVLASAALRSRMRPGSVFLTGSNGMPRTVEVRRP